MIEYTLRTSSRSRNVRLSVTRQSGLEIIVPRGFDHSRVPAIIAKKEAWIRKAIDKVQRGTDHVKSPKQIPQQIEFKCNGDLFNIVVEYHSTVRNYLIEDNGTIKLSINTRHKIIAFTLLKKWLHQKSRSILLPWLARISKEHGLPYNKGVIRFQRTRWGSCSVKKNINLNRALVFLRPELVEYLFIHELCHTIEMNHSKKYWALVGQHCPDFRSLGKELKSGNRDIGRWVY